MVVLGVTMIDELLTIHQEYHCYMLWADRTCTQASVVKFCQIVTLHSELDNEHNIEPHIASEMTAWPVSHEELLNIERIQRAPQESLRILLFQSSGLQIDQNAPQRHQLRDAELVAGCALRSSHVFLT